MATEEKRGIVFHGNFGFRGLGDAGGRPGRRGSGTLIGRQIDRQIIGSPHREGPRLTELAVSSSSYGHPIGRHFGQVRTGGTILWATDLKESRETNGGGKGRPSTTSYSYSVSMAIALSSQPIGNIGRIWADGNLLRGAAEDLKTAGTLRIYTGHDDQLPDPLLAADTGSQCPAYRGLAYVVFEDLQLGDFGNRIPALSFEILPPPGSDWVAQAALSAHNVKTGPIPGASLFEGYSHDGGSLGQMLDLLGQVLPMSVDISSKALSITATDQPQGSVVPVLGPSIAWPDGEFGTKTGSQIDRNATSPTLDALRYYDLARDYQPGLQRTGGRAPENGETVLELPATLSATNAGTLIRKAHLRQKAGRETLRYRIAEIDPAHRPGALVSLPGEVGLWLITGWEWREGGIELELLRHLPFSTAAASRDAGSAWLPADRQAGATLLDAFELPFDGAGSPDIPRIYAALSATEGRWAGAALYAERNNALMPLGQSGTVQATAGTLVLPLEPSASLIHEPQSGLTVDFDHPDAALAPATLAELANGANRLLVGGEVLQFSEAQPIGNGRWQLSGLLRGRGGSEAEAAAGHQSGSRVIVLGAGLKELDPALFDPLTDRIAAIGAAERDPVFAAVTRPGRTLQPLTPVHGSASLAADGTLALGWTRRARGAWTWLDEVETPLVEQSELYEVGVGPVSQPVSAWLSQGSAFVIPADERAAIAATNPEAAIWVRQIGSHSKSQALWLGAIT